MVDIYETISSKIIKEQMSLIGPIAAQVAQKVTSLTIDAHSYDVHISGSDKAAIVDALISRFEALFGEASVEVSRDAVKSVLKDIPKDAIPSKLQ
jgi:hypothetical protein